jgi:hypothetical protein
LDSLAECPDRITSLVFSVVRPFEHPWCVGPVERAVVVAFAREPGLSVNLYFFANEPPSAQIPGNFLKGPVFFYMERWGGGGSGGVNSSRAAGEKLTLPLALVHLKDHHKCLGGTCNHPG